MPSALSHRLIVASLIASCAFLPASSSSAQTWREVQSPHFRVVTDGSVREGRDVAREFEQMRSVFADRSPGAVLDTGAPLLILAVHQTGLHALAPSVWKQRDHVAGEFVRHWERQFALVQLDTFGDLNQAVVFHEYTHSILHANLHWLPTWLDEGMAEFYGYTRFQGDHVYLGAPSIRVALLRNDTIPIPDMLKATSRTYFKDPRRQDLFYAEAWAMVHYMTFSPDLGRGAKLNQFISLIESGTDQTTAFQQTFGDPKEFEKKLSSYCSKFAFPAGLLPPLKGLDEKSYQTRILTTAEADYDLGSFDIGVHDPKAGTVLLQAAEAADPSLAGPHEELGFLDWVQGHDQEARAEWQKAVSADPTSYRSAFALLMSGPPLNQQTPQQLEETDHTLEAIHQKAPMFAPAVVELALIQWRQGHVNQAFQTSLSAEKLEPWRAEYRLMSAHILLQGHQPALAATYTRQVAERWPGSDHDEAVDLWNRIPPSFRGDGPPLTLSLPADATIVRGTVISSSCDARGIHVDLEPTSPNPAPLHLDTKGPYENGFADTLWFGEDHYTPCFHLSGLPALAAYKTTGDGTNTLLVFEVRDNLPDANVPASTPPASTPPAATPSASISSAAATPAPAAAPPHP